MGLIDFRKIVGEIESLVARVVLPEEVRDALGVARELLERGNAAEAARVVEPLVDKFPKLSEPSVFLGLARERDGAYAAATKAFERALKRGARPEDVLPALGRAREALGDLKGAEDAYHEAARFSPDDVEVQLGLAHVALWAGAWERAAAILKRCDAGRADAALLRVVAEFRLGHLEAALRAARDVEKQTSEIKCWEGWVRLSKGDPEGARVAFRESGEGAAALVGEARALEQLGKREDALSAALRARSVTTCRVTLDLVASLSEPTVALALLEEAVALPASVNPPWEPMPRGRDEAALRVAACEAALAVGDDERVAEHLARAKELGATEGVTGAVEARWAERRGEDGAAALLWLRRFERVGDVAALVCAGRAAFRAGLLADAKTALERAAAVAPDVAGLREALASLYAQTTPTANDPLDEACRRFLDVATRVGDPAMAEAATALAAELHRPLTLAVMGEFSSGKSTFVNALLGAEVLPVGVTPTTATVNSIRYGTERTARVIRADGRVEAIAWDDLRAAIDRRLGADPRSIHEVEILWPASELMEVSLLDTPGFNAVVEGHERVAAELLTRADAVVWLFDAGQPGRASEIEPLEKLASLGVRVLGVLNKSDRVSEAERTKLVALLRRIVPDAVVDMVPFSAKRALAARVAAAAHGVEDGDALQSSGFTPLHRVLDEQFFSKARALKRDAILRRLRDAVRASRAVVVAREAAMTERRGRLAAAQTALRDVGDRLLGELVDTLLAELRAALERTVREVARDAVRFVEAENAFRSARIREESVSIVAASLSSLVTAALDVVTAAARTKLARAFSRADEAWRPILPPDAGDLFSRYGEVVRDLFVAKTLDRYRAELRSLRDEAAAAPLLQAAVARSKGDVDALSAALGSALPPLGGDLRNALKAGVDVVRDALLGPGDGLSRAIDRDALLLGASWAEPLASLQRQLEGVA